MTLAHATVAAGAQLQLQLPWNAEFNALAYILASSGRAGDLLDPDQLVGPAEEGKGRSSAGLWERGVTR